MTFIFRKLLREDFPYPEKLHEGVGTVCQLTRIMPDGQRMAVVLYLDKQIDRKAAAEAIRLQKAEVRRRTDHEWRYGAIKP